MAVRLGIPRWARRHEKRVAYAEKKCAEKEERDRVAAEQEKALLESAGAEVAPASIGGHVSGDPARAIEDHGGRDAG